MQGEIPAGSIRKGVSIIERKGAEANFSKNYFFDGALKIVKNRGWSERRARGARSPPIPRRPGESGGRSSTRPVLP